MLIPALADASGSKIQYRGDVRCSMVIDCDPAEEKDFQTEYLDYILSIKVVDDIDEAIHHINTYGSHHTDCIITEDADSAAKFMALVDSAGVYQNCSTRFADGFRYGFGAEVGISTGKLHARGPVGLDGLVTYKYKLVGDGQDRRRLRQRQIFIPLPGSLGISCASDIIIHAKTIKAGSQLPS